MNKKIYNDVDDCVVSVINKLGNEIVIATPLGLGKPTYLLNAFYKYAIANPNIQLTIITALSLIKPEVTNDLAKRLATPILERLYSNHIELDYESDRRKQRLPDNVDVVEFYFSPGEYLNNSTAQENYIYSNYTHVIRDICHYKVNVIAQMLASKNSSMEKFSLSCNADITVDLINEIERLGDLSKPLLVGEINHNLPYMYGESAELDEEQFYGVFVPEQSNELFAIPRPAVTETDFMIGLYSSALIKDNGTIQIGIGSLSEAFVSSLISRQEKNDDYLGFLKNIAANEKFANVIDEIGETSKFQQGLFASTEMLVDGFINLYERNILKRKVYDDITLQTLLNDERITDDITSELLDQLIEQGRISEKLSFENFQFLQHYGIFKDESHLCYQDGYIYLANSKPNKIEADLRKNRTLIIQNCLGVKLKNGRIIHAGFFIGSRELYKNLSNLSDIGKMSFDMRGIKKINQLYYSEFIDTLQRVNARFVNSAMKVTLLGAVVSDTLENAQVVSGVGGQYNFVAMAHELDGARSIINCPSTYVKNGK